jgi:hypothetical protein
MKIKGITLSDGTPLELNVDENPIIGYQAKHRVTGRILPQCPRHEIYSLFTLVKKMGEVAKHMDKLKIDFNIWSYKLVTIRESDVEGFTYVYVNKDKEIFGRL